MRSAWSQKMKIESLRQTCAGQTDTQTHRHTDRVTPWAPWRSQKEDEFHPFVHHIPDQIFEASSVHHESGKFISLLTHALYNNDIKLVNILRSHPAFCFPSFSPKSRDLKGLFLDESTVHSLDWKNIYCTFFYILLKRDVNFFDNPDLKDFLSCRFRDSGISSFVRFAKQFLASESGTPIPNTVSLYFRRTAICSQTMLIR